MSNTGIQFSKFSTIGMVLGILICSIRIVNILDRPTPPQPQPKESTVVEVIGRYEDGDGIGSWWSSLLVNDSGTLKVVNIDNGSILDKMNPIPKFLRKIQASCGKTMYVPITAEIKYVRNQADGESNSYGYYDSYYDAGYSSSMNYSYDENNPFQYGTDPSYKSK